VRFLAKRLAGSFEGHWHWMSALHKFASVFPRPSALRPDLTFCLLSLHCSKERIKKPHKKNDIKTPVFLCGVFVFLWGFNE
jgi:hypothetical protein